jgi:hypothetical protein
MLRNTAVRSVFSLDPASQVLPLLRSDQPDPGQPDQTAIAPPNSSRPGPDRCARRADGITSVWPAGVDILSTQPFGRCPLWKRKTPFCGAFHDGRYWARTSDPQLVETAQMFAPVSSGSKSPDNQRVRLVSVRPPRTWANRQCGHCGHALGTASARRALRPGSPPDPARRPRSIEASKE